MNDRVPFLRSRYAMFTTMMSTIVAMAVANHVLCGRLEDDIIDVGLCIVASCTLLGLVLVFQGQRRMNADNTWQLGKCQAEINRVTGRIDAFDQAIMQTYFPDGAPLHVVGPESGREAASGSLPVAEVLPMSPRESPR